MRRLTFAISLLLLAALWSGAPTAVARPRLVAWTPSAGHATGGPAWLAEINRYRAATGLGAVSEQTAWDLGIQHHLTYLEKTPNSERTGAYASAHTENPASPYYTADGAKEAGYSDLALGGTTTALAAIDGWLTSPFHAIGMLRARLTQVALGIDPTRGYAGLDVIQGIDPTQPAGTTPILFPGPGASTDLVRYSGTESPDPRETCRWQGYQSLGLPLIALLPQAPDPALTASVSGPGQSESTANGQLCIVDETTYHSSDSVYGPAGASILQGDHAVILIPRHPLVSGRYAVTITQPGQPDIAWSFAVTAPTSSGPPALGCSPCVSRSHPAAMKVPGRVRAGHAVTISVAGLHAFSLTLTIRAGTGSVLLTGSWHLPAGQWSLRPHLRGSATRRGRSLQVIAHFRVAGRRITVIRTVRFK
ncbi:MAG: CAP domain-containing protein [Solirubrobacteraceae bacterium]